MNFNMATTECDSQTSKGRTVTIDSIMKEIGYETELIKSLNEAIEEMEETTKNLEEEIIASDTGNNKKANKWRERYHSQVRINEQLENQRSLLKDELENERIKMTKGWSKIPHTNDLNDDISEAEMMRLIRQLEMVRRNLTSELRDLQWKVDQESKVYHQLNELCRIYKLEIQNAKSSIPRRKPSIEEEKFAFQRLISVPVKRI